LDEPSPLAPKKAMTLKEMRTKFEASPIMNKDLAEAEVDEIIHNVHRQ